MRPNKQSEQKWQTSPSALLRQQDGAVPLIMALLVSTGVTAGAWYMSQSQTQALEARLRIDNSSIMDELGHAALGRAYGLFNAGKASIATAPTNRGHIVADPLDIGPSSPGATNWQRVSGLQNSMFQIVCAKTGVVQGQNLGLPATVASALPNGGNTNCAAADKLLMTFRVEAVAEPTAGNFWAIASLTSEWHPDAVTLDASKGNQKVTTRFSMDVVDDDSGSAIPDACPYLDTALNTAPAKYTQDFFTGGGRYHAGWIRLGHRHTYVTTQVVPGSGWVGIRNWIRRDGMANSKNMWILPVDSPTEFVQNWEIEIQGGYGGWWAHSLRLHIPKAEPGRCYWWIASRRRPALWAGCFAPGTKITMADGTSKPVEKIVAGDLVHNPLTGLARHVTRVTTGPEEKSLLRVTVGGKTVDVSEQHPFLGRAGSLRADELKVGTEVRTGPGAWSFIESIEKIPPTETSVWNIALGDWDGRPENHYLLANGVPTGDLHLQEALERARRPEIASKGTPPTTEEVRKALAKWFGVTKDQ